MLIDTGADVNARDLDDATLLMIAAMNNHTEIAQLLITAGADVNSSDNEGLTPLHIAARNGYSKIALLLIAAGADCSNISSDTLFKLKHPILDKASAIAINAAFIFTFAGLCYKVCASVD